MHIHAAGSQECDQGQQCAICIYIHTHVCVSVSTEIKIKVKIHTFCYTRRIMQLWIFVPLSRTSRMAYYCVHRLFTNRDTPGPGQVREAFWKPGLEMGALGASGQRAGGARRGRRAAGGPWRPGAGSRRAGGRKPLLGRGRLPSGSRMDPAGQQDGSSRPVPALPSRPPAPRTPQRARPSPGSAQRQGGAEKFPISWLCGGPGEWRRGDSRRPG